MAKPTIPPTEAQYRPWLERLIGTPLHKSPPKPPAPKEKP